MNPLIAQLLSGVLGAVATTAAKNDQSSGSNTPAAPVIDQATLIALAAAMRPQQVVHQIPRAPASAGVIGVVVALGFFATLAAIVLLALVDKAAAQQAFHVLCVAVGIEGAALLAVVFYWYGSSWGSRSKDAVVAGGWGGDTVVPAPVQPPEPAPTEPAPEPAPEPLPDKPSTADTKKFEGITATVFGGVGDPNDSAYDGHRITDSEFGVALPFRFKGTRPKVQLWKGGKSVIAEIVDVGPWNINDPYWETGHRPQAESGTDKTGRKTNKAGIDLTPAAARALGIDGKGTVDWAFVGASSKAMPTGADIVALAKTRIGEKYVNVLVPKDDANWHGPWDCAEFASWLVYQVSGVLYGCTDDTANPAKADAYTGAWKTDASTKGRMVSVSEAAGTPGAFLLRYPPAPGEMGHIAVSDGQGGTIEAAGSSTGVVAGKVSGRRWDTGVLPPGIDYTTGSHSVTGPSTIYAVGQPNMAAAKVKEIQTALAAHGFTPGDVDGEYGTNTALAAAAFQRAQGLIADGEVGPDTAKALGITL